jgi:O-antigen/teichoic acid export membrane protein
MSTPVTPTARPATVTAAFWLWIVRSVLSIIAGIVAATVGRGMPQITELSAQEQQVAQGALIAFAVIVIILSLLEALFAYFMYRGRNWARIVVTILAALSLVALITQASASGWLEWVGAALIVVAIILQFTPSANAYFRAARSAPAA